MQHTFSCSSQQAAIYRLNITLLILLIPLALLLCSSTPLPAQDEQKDKEVFTRRQLEAFNARTLAELLDALPGVSDAGSKIQGSTGGVVIFIDDRRITDAATKETNLSGYQALDIEQIEVIKGAGAAIYGDDTSGGVILITTRKEKRGMNRSCEVFTDTYRKSQMLITAIK
jgi:TonB-dependent SusC/RagA subfamily outer membrane receptor